MKETVLSAKTSGTATKGFEVIVEVIKIKKKPQKCWLVFLRRALFTFSELVRFSRSGSQMLSDISGELHEKWRYDHLPRSLI